MHYRMDGKVNLAESGHKLAIVGEQPDLDVTWRMGKPITRAIEEPIRCTLNPRGGPDMPDAFLSKKIPLFSQRLLDALEAGGVDNLDCYQVELTDPTTGASISNYKATNIIGKIKAVDLAESKFDERSSYPMLEFKRITLNEESVQQLNIFRLAENPSFIIVSQKVKDVLDKVDLIGVRIVALSDPSAY